MARRNEAWFSAEPRQELEQELRDVVTREWAAVLERLSSLLEADAVAPADRHDRCANAHSH